MRSRRREKVFGPGRAVPLDRNAKARIAAYAAPGAPATASRANTRVRSTRAFLDVLTPCCGASTTRAPAAAFRAMRRSPPRRSAAALTVAEALKALEWAGVLTWQNRITRARSASATLFGRLVARWQVIRTSNAYVFRDPKAAVSGSLACKSENRARNTESRT